MGDGAGSLRSFQRCGVRRNIGFPHARGRAAASLYRAVSHGRPGLWLVRTPVFDARSKARLDAAPAGVGWGMNPEGLARRRLQAGRLVESVPGRAIDVPR